MSRWLGCNQVTSRWLSRILPPVTVSRPEIMRRVVVLPQPEGPSKTMNSPSWTVKSIGLTACSSANFFSTFWSSMVAISLSSVLFADCAEGDAAQQVVAQGKGDDHDRDQEPQAAGGDGRPLDATDAEHGGDAGRGSARLLAGQHEGEGVLVPGEDQAEDGGGGDASHRLWQDDLEESLHAGVTVHQRGLFVLARDLVEETF